MKHQHLAKKIEDTLVSVKEKHPEIIIWDGTDIILPNGEVNVEKQKKRYEVMEDTDFPKKLYAKGFVCYAGCEDTLEVFIGCIKDPDRRYINGRINLTGGLHIRSLTEKIPSVYRLCYTTSKHPLYAPSYHGEDALIIGLKHDIVLPLLDYVDSAIEWDYNPESNAYCDGSEYNAKNREVITKSLEYILASLEYTLADLSLLEK